MPVLENCQRARLAKPVAWLTPKKHAAPSANAASAFPQAASANKSVFYHADGSAKSVHEVYDWALRQPGEPDTVRAAPVSAPASAPASSVQTQNAAVTAATAGFLALDGKRRMATFLCASILTGALASTILKDLFHRPRRCRDRSNDDHSDVNRSHDHA